MFRAHVQHSPLGTCATKVVPPLPILTTSAASIYGALQNHPAVLDVNKFTQSLAEMATEFVDYREADGASANRRLDAVLAGQQTMPQFCWCRLLSQSLGRACDHSAFVSNEPPGTDIDLQLRSAQVSREPPGTDIDDRLHRAELPGILDELGALLARRISLRAATRVDEAGCRAALRGTGRSPTSGGAALQRCAPASARCKH